MSIVIRVGRPSLDSDLFTTEKKSFFSDPCYHAKFHDYENDNDDDNNQNDYDDNPLSQHDLYYSKACF